VNDGAGETAKESVAEETKPQGAVYEVANQPFSSAAI
jgi:hypothetical protein